MADEAGDTDGNAGTARLAWPSSLAFDAAGNLFVSEDYAIRKVTPTGVVSTFATGLWRVGQLAFDGAGNLLVAEYESNQILRYTPSGVATVVAGGSAGIDGPAIAARFQQPRGVAVDARGYVYVADSESHVIRRIDSSGNVSTFAGTPFRNHVPASETRFNAPEGVAVDAAGNVFVADTGNAEIRRISLDGRVTQVAGAPRAPLLDNRGYLDGPVNEAKFLRPTGVAVDRFGTVYVADEGNAAIRKISAGVVTTLLGGNRPGFGLGEAFGIAIDANDELILAHAAARAIFRIGRDGSVTLIAGSAVGEFGVTDGPATAARFYYPRSIAVAGDTIFVGDAGMIRKIDATGRVRSVAGPNIASGGALPPGNVDGVGDAVRFAGIGGLAAGPGGVLYVSDSGNKTIRKGVLAPVAARLHNFSVLASLAGGEDALTIGTIIGGADTRGAKPLLVRAAGPSLGMFGVTGTLDDPRLELYAGATRLDGNDNWTGAADLGAMFARVGAFPFASAASRDAALLATLPNGGNISTRVMSANASGGVTLVEVYDGTRADQITPETPRLINVSLFKPVGDGFTAGFIVGGTGTKTVLIRGAGPALAAFGVNDTLDDPFVALHDSDGSVLATNDNWGGSGIAATLVGAFAFASGSRDAALLATLEPGNYTVQLRGATGGTGAALLEIYEVP